MNDESITDFGVIIAYLLPGLSALWGLAQLSPEINLWLGGTSASSATIGGFLYVTLASVAAGLTASTVRWLLIDPIHHATGVRPPKWDFSQLGDRVEAFDLLVEIHYRYYQFYANTLVSALFAYGAWRTCVGFENAPWGWPDVAMSAFIAMFFAASRNTLKNYYLRAGKLLK